MNKPRFTLSRKLSLGILLMAVPIFIASLGVFFYYSRNLLHDTVTEHANSILNTTMQNVVNYMGGWRMRLIPTSGCWRRISILTPCRPSHSAS